MHKLVRLRPAAVEIIQGCVYHKYFELLNSNNINGHYIETLYDAAVSKNSCGNVFVAISATILSPEYLSQISSSHYGICLVLLFYSLSILTNLFLRIYADNLCILAANRKDFVLLIHISFNSTLAVL